jgi:hypothetical protein
LRLPLFALNTVLFPGGSLSLKVFEARYVDMTASCLREGRPFGVCMIRAGREVGEAAVPAAVGTLAWIRDADVPKPGIFHLRVEGGQRFVVEETGVEDNQLLVARVTAKPDEAPAPLPEEFAVVMSLLRAVAESHPEAGLMPLRDEMPWVGYRLAEVLPLKAEARQALLEMNDSRMRLTILLEFMRRQGLL